METRLLDKTETAIENRLTEATDLIPIFLHDMDQAGLVGERENAVAVFFSAASAALDRPLSVSIHASSSAGKNFLLEKATLPIPEENKIFLSGMTPKALMHAGEDEYQHKAIIIAEYEGAARADFAIRTFQSEKKIEWDFVDTGTKGIKKKRNVVKGPAAFLQATTRPVLHPENETRLLYIGLDESPEQTARIIQRQAELAASGSKVSDPDARFQEWREFMSSLKSTQVRIPFAIELTQFFPKDRIRMRRDFPKFLDLIEVSAHLHQHHRKVEEDEALLATNADYQTAKWLFEKSYETGPDRAVEELLTAVEQLKTFRVCDLMEKTGWGKSKVYMVLARAEELGCVGEGEERGKYHFIRHSAIPPLELPDSVYL